MVLNSSQFIVQHKDDDVHTLALKKMPEGVDAKWALQQIEGYQLAKKKLPTWATAFETSTCGVESEGGIIFPPRISMEQCSSELTAKYKAQLSPIVNCKSSNCKFLDLTGGFGVDFSYMAQGFRHAVYVEQNEELCSIAQHNFPPLGLPHAQVINTTCEQFLSTLSLQSPTPPITPPFTPSFTPLTIYLDPARRDTHGRKVVTIEDCTPNLLELQDRLLHIADHIIIKLSPMLDITDALRKLRNVAEVHVISVRGECKELLFIIDNSESIIQNSPDVTVHCVNLDTDDEPFVTTLRNNLQSSILFTSSSSFAVNLQSPTYLYEPNASIMKAGVQDAFGMKYGLQKLAPNSNLFVSSESISHIPARRFRIVGITDFNKTNLRNFLKDIRQANLTVRNFPSDVASLRKRLKLKEGGTDYLFATTLHDGTHALLRCVKE